MITRALIPAAGRGLRLDRANTPKPLVDVDGQPLLFRLIRGLREVGVERMTVVVGFGGEAIETALRHCREFGNGIDIIKNPDWEAGLAASVLSARESMNEPFLLAMADHVFDPPLIRQMANADMTDVDAAALVDLRLGDIFDLDTAVKIKLEGDVIADMGAAISNFDAVDAGLFALRPEVFLHLQRAMRPGVENQLADGLAGLILEGRMRAVRARGGCFDDVDTPAALIHAEMRLRRQRRTGRVERKRGRAMKVSAARFSYNVHSPRETEILVGRGYVRDPSKIPLIPERSSSSPIFVFTDETVGGLYGREFTERLRGMGYDASCIVLPDGEGSKSIANYAFLVERVLAKGVDERSVFISLGGGVICNVCGFVASTIYRGLDLVHLPTTLMSQCDAAISHKQGINGYQGKNLVGSYYSPRLVAVDVASLTTLPDRLLSDGMAEVIKHAVGQDADYAALLLDHGGDLRALDFLETVIKRNVRLKCELVTSDPQEHREGMVLQYGHTVGHAVETLSGYRLYHGEAVAVGMAVAARVARILGACDGRLVERQDELNRKFSLPVHVPGDIHTGDILAALRYGKRYLVEGIRMALPSSVGRLWRVDGDFAIPVSEKIIAEAVDACRDRPRLSPARPSAPHLMASPQPLEMII